MAKLRVGVMAIVCVSILLFGPILLPRVSAATTMIYPNPDVHGLQTIAEYASNDLVASAYWDCEWSPIVAGFGAEHVVLTTAAATADVNKVYTFGGESTYTCPSSGTYKIWYYWTAAWQGSYVIFVDGLLIPLGYGEVDMFIRTGCNIYDLTAGSWVTHSEEYLDALEVHRSVYSSCNDEWPDAEYHYLKDFDVHLISGHTYMFYSTLSIRTYVKATGVAFANAGILFVGQFRWISITPVEDDEPVISCVAEGTMVTMADGSELPVERVKKGDKVLGYDPESGAFMAQAVSETWSTKVEQVLNINDGALRVTLRDQPLYVMDPEGNVLWLRDPIDLKTGWRLYSPESGLWTVIDSLLIESEKTRVYDFLTDGYQTFIGNSFLLMDKGHKK